jgi:ElaB/YqjD/DUF883 family membrane-anchored ribosome-binding protein
MKKGMMHTMEKRTKELAEDVRHSADELAEKTRAAGRAALETARAAYEVAETRASAGAKATDHALHEYPYRFVGVAFSVGLIIGFLLKRR